MKACVVFCSIRSTKAFQEYANNFSKYGHKPDVIVVDESGETRDHIKAQLKGFPTEFFGARERGAWFKIHKLQDEIVPAKTTDVVGFSLLVAYPRKYDMIVFVDDDTYPIEGTDFLGEHWRSLNSRNMKVVGSSNRWVKPYGLPYGRGFPYVLRRSETYSPEQEKRIGAVLNMGLWNGVPDLNAMDYLFFGSVEGTTVPHEWFGTSEILAKNCFFALSRMNIAFKPKIIPAFYQGTGNEFGIGRYGDVFSGLFIMKIAAHLGDNVSFGVPVCLHRKEPRDVFKDINAELEAVKLNETLWTVLDKIKLSKKSYSECYLELAKGLELHKDVFHLPNYILYLANRMKNWVSAVSTVADVP